MRVLLSTYGSPGGVEPMVGLTVRVRALGTEVRGCAPPVEEFAVGLSTALVGQPMGSMVRPSSTVEVFLSVQTL
jgi:hypothetical protein